MMMKRISIQLPEALIQLLEQRARAQKISVSATVRALIQKGFIQDSKKKGEEIKPHSPSKVEGYLLKSNMEALLLLRRLLSKEDKHYLPEALEMAEKIVRQLFKDSQNISQR